MLDKERRMELQEFNVDLMQYPLPDYTRLVMAMRERNWRDPLAAPNEDQPWIYYTYAPVSYTICEQCGEMGEGFTESGWRDEACKTTLYLESGICKPCLELQIVATYRSEYNPDMAPGIWSDNFDVRWYTR